jgi:insertion element IS1 protein InsB
VDRLLLERLSFAGIARAAQVSESWSQKYVNEQYENTPKEIAPSILPEKNFSPVIECDER